MNAETTITLAKGAHSNPEEGMCLLEAASFVAGEAFSDTPQCVSPVLGSFGRSLNDVLPTAKRQELVPLIPRIIGTRGDRQRTNAPLLHRPRLAHPHPPAHLPRPRTPRRGGQGPAPSSPSPTCPPPKLPDPSCAPQGPPHGPAAGAAARAAAGAAAWDARTGRRMGPPHGDDPHGPPHGTSRTGRRTGRRTGLPRTHCREAPGGCNSPALRADDRCGLTCSICSTRTNWDARGHWSPGARVRFVLTEELEEAA